MENQAPGVQQILAKNIRDARKKLGYSQQTLAERAEISPGHMNDLEQGRKWVSADTLERLADALGLEPFMLLMPNEYSSRFDAFNLLTDYATTVRETVGGAIDESLRAALHRAHKEPSQDE